MLKDYYDRNVILEKNEPIKKNHSLIPNYTKYMEIDCLIDFMAGPQKQLIAGKQTEDTTHILMCNLLTLQDKGERTKDIYRINDSGQYYRVLYIDYPFKKHTEMYLEYVGVDNV